MNDHIFEEGDKEDNFTASADFFEKGPSEAANQFLNKETNFSKKKERRDEEPIKG